MPSFAFSGHLAGARAPSPDRAHGSENREPRRLVSSRGAAFQTSETRLSHAPLESRYGAARHRGRENLDIGRRSRTASVLSLVLTKAVGSVGWPKIPRGARCSTRYPRLERRRHSGEGSDVSGPVSSGGGLKSEPRAAVLLRRRFVTWYRVLARASSRTSFVAPSGVENLWRWNVGGEI